MYTAMKELIVGEMQRALKECMVTLYFPLNFSENLKLPKNIKCTNLKKEKKIGNINSYVKQCCPPFLRFTNCQCFFPSSLPSTGICGQEKGVITAVCQVGLASPHPWLCGHSPSLSVHYFNSTNMAWTEMRERKQTQLLIVAWEKVHQECPAGRYHVGQTWPLKHLTNHSISQASSSAHIPWRQQHEMLCGWSPITSVTDLSAMIAKVKGDYH